MLTFDARRTETGGAVEEFRTLIKQLEGRGLQTQVRHGYGQSLLVLVRAPRNLLGKEVYRSRYDLEDLRFDVALLPDAICLTST